MSHTIPILDDPTYKIESELGSGGGGVVYKAWHNRLQKHVVLKRIRENIGLKPDHMRIEVDILKNLKHSHLPQLYDFIADDGGTYTVMEYIPGQSFADLLANGQKFSQQQVIRWAEQLSSALAYLHSQKPPVLHSDIKPANVMLTPEGDVCLIDFNVSLMLDGDSAAVIGRSHGYASPEQYGPEGLPSSQQIAPESNRVTSPALHSGLTETEELDADNTEMLDTDATEKLSTDDSGAFVRANTSLLLERDEQPERRGKRGTQLIRPWDADDGKDSTPAHPESEKRRMKIRMDTRSDIYSLGATMYHLLTGEMPAIATGEIKPLGSFGLPLSEAVVYIVEKCMERDPARRFQSAAQLHDAIVGIHKLDRRWKRQNTHKNVAAALFTVLFVGFGVLTLLGWKTMGEEKLADYNRLVLTISERGNEADYQRAIGLFPDKIDAYHAWAVAQYGLGEYENCIKYIDTTMSRLSTLSWNNSDIRRIGDIYFVQGNCNFELEDYLNAIACYESAIQNNSGNPEFYRDYAIALARSGNIDRAAELLEEIKTMKISSDSISLLRGEIALARQNYHEAVDHFKETLSVTDNDYIKQRTYLICDKAYQRMPEMISDEIELLREAALVLPEQYQAIITERLADTLVRAGRNAADGSDYYLEAITLFEGLQRGGNATYGVWQNIGLLYQETGDFAAARSVYFEMLSVFPDRYQVPMRLAYLTLEEQAALANEERDYSETAKWYDESRTLYAKRPQNAGDDMEMLTLDSIMDDLRQNDWIQEG